MSSIATLPTSVVEVIEQTGSPSAGLRKLRQMRGLKPIQRTWDVALGGVRKKEQLGQFCAVFAPQVEAAKQVFADSQAPAPTTRKPKAPSKSAEVTLSAAEYHSLMQRIEVLEAGLGEQAERKPATRKPKAAKPKAKATKVVVEDSEPHTFTANAVESRGLPTKSGAEFTWKRRKGGESKWLVIGKNRDGSINAVKLA